MAFIKAISYYLPDNVLDNGKINLEHPEWSVDKISDKTGIFERRIAGENQFASDLAIEACEKLFKEHSIERCDIDFILYCTQSPDYFLPTTACILQEKLKLKTSIGALDFNLGCSGYVYGLSLAKGLIAANIASNVLLITAETYSKFINKRDKSNKTLFGDAASATLITKNVGYCEIGDFVLGTDGKGAENLIVKNGGIRNRFEKSGDIVDENNNYIRNDDYLYMDGGEIFNFTSSSIPTLVNEILEKHSVKMDDIDQYIFHQANKFMLNFIRKKMNIPVEKFFLFLKNCGNTVSSTIPIALSEAINAKAITKDNKVMITGFGVGYSWGGTILHF